MLLLFLSDWLKPANRRLIRTSDAETESLVSIRATEQMKQEINVYELKSCFLS